MGDRLDFSISGVEKSIEYLREENSLNQKNQEKCLDYINNTLAPQWTTNGGTEALDELRTFVQTRFQEYVDYLNGRIDVLENDIVPALIRINNA